MISLLKLGGPTRHEMRKKWTTRSRLPQQHTAISFFAVPSDHTSHTTHHTYLSQRAEAEAEDLVVQYGGGGSPQLHAHEGPVEEEVVIAAGLGVVCSTMMAGTPAESSKRQGVFDRGGAGTLSDDAGAFWKGDRNLARS